MNFLSTQPNKFAGIQRISILLYSFYGVVGIIIIRLFYLQIIQGDFFYQKSLGNTEREFRISATRGLILDRYGRVLAQNKTAFSLSLVRGYVPKKKEVRDKLFQNISETIGIDKSYLEKKYIENRRSFQPLLIKESLSRKEVIFFNEFSSEFPFLTISEYSGREYPYKEALAPILGYIGAIDSGEYKKYKKDGYFADSFIGKSGLEKQYDLTLKGQDGKIFKIVDSMGRVVFNQDEKTIVPISGKNLVLSIDAELQDMVYHAFRGRRGAVIVTKVSTGEVLALVSAPSYDANTFMNSNNRNEIFNNLLQDENKPFLNRAIQGHYSPGSVFKIVVALSALEDGKLDPNKVEDTSLGYFKLGNHIFKDHGVKPYANLAGALEKSNNVYFYRLAYNLGYASILEHATLMGLRAKTNIDIPNERVNFTPTPEWKEKRFNTIWVDGDTVNIGIGQGFLLLTPIGIHNIISTIASGRVITPHIVWSEQNPYTGVTEKQYTPQYITNFQPKSSTLEAIKVGLMQVPYTGTGIYHKYLSKVLIAGKTGTAQNSTDKDNALFTSYGPTNASLENQYAVTVVVESAGFGSGVVPISSSIYNYLTGEQTKDQAIEMLNRILPAIKNVKEED